MLSKRSGTVQPHASEKKPSLYARLKAIDTDLITKNPGTAVWNLETIVRELRITRRSQNQKLVEAIEAKIDELKQALPHMPRVPMLKGMLHERLHENGAALRVYKSVRQTSPHCWHAYLYAVGLLQQMHRYQDSYKIANEMKQQFELGKFSNKDVPHPKYLAQIQGFMKIAEKAMEEQRQRRIEKERKIAEAQERRLVEEQRKQQQEEQQRLRSLKEKQQSPEYNPFEALSQLDESNQPLAPVEKKQASKRHAGQYGTLFDKNKAKSSATTVAANYVRREDRDRVFEKKM